MQLSELYRDWEQWDRPGVSQWIDSYWTTSQTEMEHREKLAFLVRQWISPLDHFLEVGCGSGLVYKQLLLPSYVGIDISEAMLSLAKNRFPEGTFLKDDLYKLSFSDNSFDIVAAFEVFGHLDEIEKPIQEMFRVSSRLVFFTIWTGQETKIGQEIIGDSVFIHKIYSQEEICQILDRALEGKKYTLTSQPLSYGPTAITAYILKKEL